nr:hypothetical protein [Pseudomonas sp.]
EQFLGLAGYYRRFIAGFSKLASPLSQLCGTLQKVKDGARRAPPRKPFVWGAQQQEAFESLTAPLSDSNASCCSLPHTNGFLGGERRDPSFAFCNVPHSCESGKASLLNPAMNRR